MSDPIPTNLEIRLDRLGKCFAGRWIFRNTNARVSLGETLAISGRNGSGKSTLLRVIAGLLRPSEGDAIYAWENHLLESAARRAITGYAAPDLSLYRELSGAENLRFFARLRGIDLSRSDLADLLLRVGLKGRGKDLVGAYSSGMRQRLKLAFALLHRPTVLLLDEPTANLDEEGVTIVEEIVSEHTCCGIAIIATNEPREVAWGNLAIHLGADDVAIEGR